MKTSLKDVVNEWLETNLPHLYVDDNGSIGLVEEKDKTQQPFGKVWLGNVMTTKVRLWQSHSDMIETGFEFVYLNAADPDFFEKLAKHLK